MVPDEAERMIERTIGINKAAAGYLVDLAKALNLVTNQLVLTGFGKVARTLGGDSNNLALNEREKPFYLALFLETDALVFSQVAAACLKLGRFRNADLARGKVIEAAFRGAFAVLIDRAGLIQERVALKRQLQDLPTEYKGRTHEHKLDVRVKLLEQLGMLERRGSYFEVAQSITPLANLASNLPGLAETVSRSSSMDISLGLLRTPTMREVQIDEITIEVIGRAFLQIEGSNGRLAGISAAEFLTASIYFESGAILASETFAKSIDQLSKGANPPIRVHVDRSGKRALFSIEKSTIARLRKPH
jgi:hypothetical protein